MGEHKKKHYSLGFRHGELVTVVISEISEVENAIDVDYYVEDPQEPEKQLEEWLKKV